MFESDDFKLASLDFLGSEDELRARAQQELRDAGDDTRAPTRQEGADESGSVRVAMDRDGVVSEVDISRGWRERVAAAGFADALYQAYNAAVVKQLNAVALDAFGAQERSEDGHGPVSLSGLRSPVDNADERVWLGSVWSILADNDDNLHRLERGERLTSGEQTVTGPHGYLTLRYEGRGVTGISGDAELIKGADHEQLRVEALAVFRAALEHSGREDS